MHSQPAVWHRVLRSLVALSALTACLIGSGSDSATETPALPAARPVAAPESSASAAPARHPHEASALELTSADIVYPRKERIARAIPVSGSLESPSQLQVRAKMGGEVSYLLDVEGARVRRGQLVAAFDKTQLNARLAERRALAASARAELVLAEKSLKAQRELVAEGFVSQNSIDTVQTASAAKKAALDAAESQVEVAKKALLDADIRSNIDGVVFKRHARPGEYVLAGTPLLTLIDPRKLELLVTLSALDRSAVSTGMSALLAVPGTDANFSATVDRVSPIAEPGTRSYAVYLKLNTAPASLLPGMYVRGELVVNAEPMWNVPAAAVRGDPPNEFLWSVVDGRIARRQVVVASRDAFSDRALISSPLSPDQPVVLTRLSDSASGRSASIVPRGASQHVHADLSSIPARR